MSRAIGIGDQVTVVNASELTAKDLTAVYGKRWKEPFTVESINRSHRYIAVAGGGPARVA